MVPIFLGNFKKLSPVKVSYNLLAICGLMNQEGRPWTLIIVTYHGIMLVLLGTLSAVKVYMDIEDFKEIIQPSIVCVAVIHIVAKFVTILTSQTKLRSLLNRLEQLRQQELEDSTYASQVSKADKINKTLIYYTNLYFNLAPFFSTVMNFISDYITAAEIPTLNSPLWMPWNYQKSWPYVAALFASTFLVFTGITLFATFYSLLFTVTFQLSALLKILQAKMEVKKANDKSIFLQHVNILQLLQQFNELFSGQYYLEILISSIQPCGYCYMLIKKLKSGGSRWLDLLYKFILTLSAPFMLCACGEEINSQVEKLHESSYNCSWYEEQPSARKDLLILMTATSRPASFNYRGLIKFNLMCFATVIQGFYSYITMLVNFETNE